MATAPLEADESALMTHPFYRFPLMPSNTELIQQVDWLSVQPPLNAFASLLAMRTLFKKDRLTSGQADTLARETTFLLFYARNTMHTAMTSMGVSKALDCVSHVLLVLDALLVASHVLGPRSAVDDWWPLLMQSIPYSAPRIPSGKSTAHVQKVHMFNEVSQLIEKYYRKGFRPPASVLVPLKRQFLCTHPTARFKKAGWAPWRKDDEEWLAANPSRLPAS